MFTEEYIQKIRDLLLSEDEANVVLGIQLVSKNFPKELLQDFYALSLTIQSSGETFKKARKIFKKNASEEWWDFSKRKRINFSKNVNEQLKRFCDFKEVDKKIVAWYALKKFKKGLRFCLDNQAKKEEKILEEIIENNELYLGGFDDIDRLPKAMGSFIKLSALDISYTNITEIPDELAKLKHLKKIEFSENQLSPKAIKKLEKFFPKIFSLKYAYKAGSLLNQIRNNNISDKENKLKEIFKVLTKASSIYDNNSTLWNNWAVYWSYSQNNWKAIECSKKAISFDKKELKPLFYGNLVIYLSRENLLEEALSLSEEGLDLFSSQKSRYKRDYAFIQAAKGLNLLRMKEYKKSIQANLEATQIDPNNKMANYNIACAYALLRNKEKMLDFLQKTIQLSPQDIDKIREDKDFEYYWEDEDFKALLKKYKN